VSSIDNETLLLAIRFGHCSAVHAATLREAGGTWALDALRANEMQRAEVERLRAIKAAAREVAANVEDDIDARLSFVVLRDVNQRLRAENQRLRSENERLQMQLAACGVLASCNTSDSLERHRQMHPDFLGASVHAVIEAAQREIKLLAEVRRLRAIEAAARSYMVCAHAGPWEQFTSSLASLEAALAAKNTP
jgi:hypothetical protein